MEYGQASEWSRKVTEYFGHGYSDEQVLDITKYIRDYSGIDAERIYTGLKLTNRATYKIGLKELSETASELGIRKSTAFAPSQFLHGAKTTCVQCGQDYYFNRMAPAYEFTGPVSSCPKCGWYHAWDIDWELDGNPGKDRVGSFGPVYSKRCTEWQDGLAERIQRTLKASQQDQRAHWALETAKNASGRAQTA